MSKRDITNGLFSRLFRFLHLILFKKKQFYERNYGATVKRQIG